jgi:pimeloyl-ACP methyl ester carboxylesterase
VGRVVLAACNAFDNFPPGLTGKTLVLTGKLSPRMFGLFMEQMRLRAIRRLPIAFGWLTLRGDAATALVVWASKDRVMPPEHGRRLADLLPQGRLVEVADSYTLIPLDQPARLAQVIREFTNTSDRT